MAAQADATAGFYEEVSHAETPDVFGRGARYAVGGAGDLRVQAGGAGDRSVTVATGKAWGDAVLAYWTSGPTVLNAIANGGSARRWDTLVIRRNWSTETATLMLLQGGSTEALAPGVVLRNPSAGVGAGFTVADQPLALVPVDPSSTSAVINGADIRDLRLWSGEGGGLLANHIKARDYVASVGTTLRIGSTLHTRMLDLSGNPYWDVFDFARASLPPAVGPAYASYAVGTAKISDRGTWLTLDIPDPGYPYFLEATAQGEWVQSSGRHDFGIVYGSATGGTLAFLVGLPTETGFKVVRTRVPQGPSLNTPFTGPTKLFAIAYKVGNGTALGNFTQHNASLLARVIPA
ncbi:hypothetical protein SAMN04487781_3233 [Cellulosimicrobium cellulans]|nr:hypothetical protein SAMN04487781_3233 [Cellulosimicrobium cellulans]